MSHYNEEHGITCGCGDHIEDTSDTRTVNTLCITCDYYNACRKRIRSNKDRDMVLAKDQDEFPMPCICVVQDICRTCQLYHAKKCAAWRIFNGNRSNEKTVLKMCPRKVPLVELPEGDR